MAASGLKHTAADENFLDNISDRQLKNFWNYVRHVASRHLLLLTCQNGRFTPACIKANPGLFLDHEWIDISILREFLCRSIPDAGVVVSSMHPSDSIHVKIEAPERLAPMVPTISVKAELQSMVLSRETSTSAKICTSYEGGREVLELLFDSEAEVADDSDIGEVSEELTRLASRSSSVFPLLVEIAVDDSDDKFHTSEPLGSADVIDTKDSDDELLESDTVWQDPITLFVHTSNFEITRRVKNIKCIEYVSKLASIYPIHRNPTVFVVDLDNPKIDLLDPKTGQLYTVDYLISNADNDSWENGGSGSGSSTAIVTFVPNVVHYELDPASRNTVLSAQAEMRRNDGTTPEQNAVIFKKVVGDAKCTAIDSNGNRCQGGTNDEGQTRAHAHIVNGTQVHAVIRQYPCLAMCAIYVPTDRSIRKALIVHNDTGHNHPMPTLTKVSLAVKQIYRQCVEARGCVGVTVVKVDNAPLTKLILKGKTPAAFFPTLSSKRTKREIVQEVKHNAIPKWPRCTFHLYLNGLTKPLPKHYIHSYIMTPDGGICILNCVPFLLKLLDDPGVIAFDDDTTYKQVEGEMNEWELTLFAKVVLHAASVVQAYINCASTNFFELSASVAPS
ncbi:hypothetical protein B0H10DRAFT_1938053 [Mycena sp. CBHHK59/15]|nr:hypothetical protein B0H10DRAFT_1938053 [Mycena sp. CBHHK59/15]